MRAVVQRVGVSSVVVDDQTVGSIRSGLLVYLGVAPDDEPGDVDLLAEKVAHLRIFPDADGKMNLDVVQAGGGVLVVSAFTVQADARKGRRPSFDTAARPEHAEPLYERFCGALAAFGTHVAQGSFGAMMQVHSVNDGPICILLDSHRHF